MINCCKLEKGLDIFSFLHIKLVKDAGGPKRIAGEFFSNFGLFFLINWPFLCLCKSLGKSRRKFRTLGPIREVLNFSIFQWLKVTFKPKFDLNKSLNPLKLVKWQTSNFITPLVFFRWSEQGRLWPSDIDGRGERQRFCGVGMAAGQCRPNSAGQPDGTGTRAQQGVRGTVESRVAGGKRAGGERGAKEAERAPRVILGR